MNGIKEIFCHSALDYRDKKLSLHFILKYFIKVDMTKVIKLKKGLDINLKGKPAGVVEESAPCEYYALVPDDFHGVVPKVVVKPGEHVDAGTPLMYDKNRPEIKFVAPVSGEVVAVNRGERRKVLDITIKADAEQTFVEFGKKSADELSGEQMKELLLQAGMFPFIKQRPYDVIANPDVTPRDIFVTAWDTAPLAPDFGFVLKGEEAHFQTGLDALRKLTSGKVYVGMPAKAPIAVSNVESVLFDGPHPTGNVGVQIQHIAPVNKGEVVWTMNAFDVLFIGRLLNKGVVDFSRLVAVTGSEVANPVYVRTCVGARIDSLLAGRLTPADYHRRIISGNVLTGTHISEMDYLRAPHSQLTVIPEGDDCHELFGWAMPGLKKFSVSHTYFSWLFPKKSYTLDARLNGGERAIIMSGEYDRVLPMDILPEFLIKAVLAFDVEKMENLGIYEVAPEDFALCEFVDTSKLEIQKIIRTGLDELMKEMN